MHLDRISYQYPDGVTAAYDLNPRLTVIDVHPAHRSALVEHLLSALWSEAPGVHVEFTLDDGHSLVAFRPYGAPARVVALDQAQDSSHAYLVDGHVDVLHPVGIDSTTATATLLASGTDLAVVDPTDAWVARLTNHDVDRLLAAAEEVVGSERALKEATARASATPQAAASVSRVYAQRNEASQLEKRHNRIRLATMVIGTACPVAAVVGLNTIGGGPAMGLILGSVAVAGGCLAYERKLARAVDAEYDALAATGVGTYNELDSKLAGSPLANATQRDLVLDAAERFRRSSAVWQELAGDIPAPWVIAERERLTELSKLRSTQQPVAVAHTEGTPCSAALLAGLMGRADAIKELSTEALPLFLDDPLAGLSWGEKVPVLEYLNRLSEHQQMVLCTDDLELLGWARLEAMAGNASVLDVNPGRSFATADTTPGE